MTNNLILCCQQSIYWLIYLFLMFLQRDFDLLLKSHSINVNIMEFYETYKDTFHMCLSKSLCQYVWARLIHILFERNAEAPDANIVYSWARDGVLQFHLFYIKYRVQSLLCKLFAYFQQQYCSIDTILSIFKQNFSEKNNEKLDLFS